MTDNMMPELTLTPDTDTAAAVAVPELTLTPDAPEVPQEEEKKIEPVAMDESLLTEEERKAVNAFSQKIDIRDTNQVLQYGAAAQNAVTEMTNELLKKNADTLKMGTIATAKEAERSIVDIETLQHTNQQLISTLDEVARIQKEGAAKRKEAEAELGRIEGELKQKLLELRS